MLCAITWLVRDVRVASKLVALIAPVQVLVTASLLYPFLTGAAEKRILFDGLVVDGIASGFLLLTSLVVAAALGQAYFFFLRELDSSDPPDATHVRAFYTCSLLFLVALTAVYLCDNLGFMWISIEATTLATAGLVYYNRTKHALEATWKYFIICSVGIAFALLGTILFFASSQHGALDEGSLNISELTRVAPQLDRTLLKLGFIFCLLGYGTKAGIFPLHSWLPDAHSEAPAPASAMLSGALLNGALFAIWRITELVTASHQNMLHQDIVLWMGAITTLCASLFLVRQHGLKRLWAYSSIENVGIMLMAIGLGSGALFLLQAINHSLAKVALFLLSGNIIQCTGTKELHEIKGLLKLAPAWAMGLMLAALAVTGVPPFGSFISEWMILSAGSDLHRSLAVGLLILALALAFIAVSFHIGRILFGTPKSDLSVFRPIGSTIIPALLIVLSLVLGAMTPSVLAFRGLS